MKTEKEQVQESMVVYLNSKYGMEFEVNSPYITGSMRTSHYQAKVHPKSQPEIEFLINGDVYSERMNGKYTESYPTAKWSYQGKQEVEKKLREVYGENGDFNISAYEFHANVALRDLDYAQVFEKGGVSIELHYEIFIDSAKFDKEVEAGKAYQILKSLILDNKSTSYEFSVRYIDKALKQDYQDQEKSGRHCGIDELHEQKKLLNFLQSDYKSVVNNDRELVKFLKY